MLACFFPSAQNQTTTPTADAEIERLAKLPLFDYERARETAAEKLGVRVIALDRAVKAQRDKDIKHDGKFLAHWEVEPWPEAVDGDALLKDLAAHFKRFVVFPKHADTAVCTENSNSDILAMQAPEKCM